MTDQPKYSQGFITVCLVLNVMLSIGIVLLNKCVYTYYGFPNMTMTCIHFIFTALGMFICRVLGVFTPKTLPLMKMVPISLTFCGFVVLTNLSLQTNTVGTYQLIKSMTAPCVIALQTYIYGREFSTKVKLTLVPITVGVFLNSMYDLKFNIVGVIIAGFGVLVTSLYQVFVAEKQKEFSVNSMQLLYYQAPMSAVAVACVVPFFEPLTGKGGVFGPWSMQALLLVSATGVVAFAINLSIFWIIGNTSPLTYNMVGHTKFTFILVSSFILFRDPIQLMQLGGIGITFSGLIAYTHTRMQEQKQKAAEAAQDQAPEKSLEVVVEKSPEEK